MRVRLVSPHSLLQLPHASTLDSTRAFLGMVGNLREFSVIWEEKELGVTLKSAADVPGSRIGGGRGALPGCDGAATSAPVVFSVSVRIIRPSACSFYSTHLRLLASVYSGCPDLRWSYLRRNWS